MQPEKIPGCFEEISATYTVSPMDTVKPRPGDPSDSGPQARKRLVRQSIPDPIREEEARLLKIKYQERKKKDPTLNQEKIADWCGWAGQSVVSQYLNGKIALNLSALIKFASILDFDPSEISPRLMASHSNFDVDHIYPKKAESFVSPDNLLISSTKQNLASQNARFNLQSDTSVPGEDEVELPFFRETELSAGQGSVVMLDLNGQKQLFAKCILQQKNIDPTVAACVPVTGNSMEPVLPDGSIVGVDTSPQQIQDGKMYAVDHDGLLRVKLLYRLPGGGLRLKSYNDAEHPDERYDSAYVSEHIRLLGKVFWYSVLL